MNLQCQRHSVAIYIHKMDGVNIYSAEIYQPLLLAKSPPPTAMLWGNLRFGFQNNNNYNSKNMTIPESPLDLGEPMAFRSANVKNATLINRGTITNNTSKIIIKFINS